MKKRTVWIIIILLLFLFIQLIPWEQPPVTKNNPDDLMLHQKVPEDVARLLKTSCYDCHSNETVYPWYSKVAPVSWLVRRDVKEGRKELNFSEWNKLKITKKAKNFDKIAEYTESGEMPMKIYIIMHPNAKLDDNGRKKIIEWANNAADALFGDDD